MSGGYGWHQTSSNVSHDSKISTDHSYDDARQQYQKPAVTVTKIGQQTNSQTKVSPIPSVWPKRDIRNVDVPIIIKGYPEAKHSLKSAATNVIIVVVDVTRSMDTWPGEIFARLPTFYIEACQYFGTDDLEVLFIAHGDVRSDNFPIQVSKFGRGAELDPILASFYTKCGGGGQGDESQELVAYYLLKQVDTSSAQNVYTFFVTDEAACDSIDPKYVKEYLDIPMDCELTKTKDVFASLQRKGKVFTILCETNNPRYNPISIKKNWEDNLGKDNIIPLNDSRRVVDVMLGAIAKLTGQLAQFTQNLTTRQQGTRHSVQNIEIVQTSISFIGGSLPKTPQGKVKKPLV